MTGESIIYFAKEWGQQPTSCDHVFRHLSKHNSVLWVNSVATRTPNLSSARDWKRMFNKLRQMLGGSRQVGPTAWVFQPVVIPLPYSGWARSVNRMLLRWSLRRQARKLKMHLPQVWAFIPNVGYLLGAFPEALVVYYCVDLWAGLPGIEDAKLRAMERELLARADVCFGTAHSLVDYLKKQNPNSFLALHGVDHGHFARALDPGIAIPDDVARLPKPIIGFFGAIHEWMDVPLITLMAQSHPEWSIVLIGKAEMSTDALSALPNVHLLGPRPYESLPGYCKAFAVGLIPFVINEMTLHINPIKLREYLSAGLPVVSTGLPEVRRYGSFVQIGESPEEFIRQIERACQEDSPAKRQERSDAVKSENWEGVVENVCQRVELVKAAKAK